ncbi:efflux RND transporter periplasmic adaptor subunit [Acidithiobacillus ferrooxidans F221]|uniref:efflux RND transporter periplasmic adaptor subunit n=1 Tax=Acidithiobacillus ferrooxidans TaxID=920 RepID=UPI001C0650AE|nr:efflux RND transporter periplasmic adaptor subunit [Acidithiobacillus ferrooxidans]MBU2808189.1 efflux RND transporter periplasmic adaptor subunit [Acidithiobacillus ferrooxidans F221]
MKKAFVIVILVLLILFGGIFGFKLYGNYMMHQALAHMPVPVVSVSASKVVEREWHPEVTAVGSFAAIQGVEVTPQLGGAITGIYFHSGEYVKAGTPLIQIDNSNQLAQLASDEAQRRLAQINLRRTQTLIATKAASQSQLDSAVASYQSAVAAVRNDHATLAKLAIRAPFSGYLGVRQVDLGQYIIPGTAMVDLQSWDPLFVNFTVPQSDFARIHVGTPVQVEVDSYPGQTFSGKITAMGAAINTATRQIDVQATVPNPKTILRPGMFGNVTVIEKRLEKVLTVPASAITYNTFGDFVYVVEKKTIHGKESQIALQRIVKTGIQRGSEVQILSGLRAGELVVTGGQIKLHEGSPVEIPASGKA